MIFAFAEGGKRQEVSRAERDRRVHAGVFGEFPREAAGRVPERELVWEFV
jgi:hypothetical protein